MNTIWKCPNGHLNSFRVLEYSPDINYLEDDPQPCEECDCEFDDKTWEFVEIAYDED